MSRGIWRRIERDLYRYQPFSAMLVAVPFVPMIVAESMGAPAPVVDVLLLAGFLLAMAWLGFVLWRRFRHGARALELSVRRNLDPDPVGSVCPICLTELDDPPEAERHAFAGWMCPTCGTELDRYAQEIRL